MGNVRPSSYTASITMFGFDNDLPSYTTFTKTLMETKTVTVLEANVNLPLKRLWDVVFLAYGCEVNELTNGIELSIAITTADFCRSYFISYSCRYT